MCKSNGCHSEITEHLYYCFLVKVFFPTAEVERGKWYAFGTVRARPLSSFHIGWTATVGGCEAAG